MSELDNDNITEQTIMQGDNSVFSSLMNDIPESISKSLGGNLINSKRGSDKKHTKIERMVDLLMEELQINGSILKNDFLQKNDFKQDRRRLGDVVNILSYFKIIKSDSYTITLISKVRTNPPIEPRKLEKEIEQLLNNIRALKEELGKEINISE